jgi:hypothetical protein
MTLARSVSEVISERVTLEVECIDRLYLNLYVPILQRPEGAAFFFRKHRGVTFASSVLMAPMTKAFVAAIERFCENEAVPLIQFKKGERKENIAKEHLSRFQAEEGVLFVGKAQEKASVLRTETRRDEHGSYPWLVRSTAMVNHYYFYCVDRDFGPFFIKFCSYFPYNGKVCLNGHEYVKRQLTQRGLEFEALDNGILSCSDPGRLQRICDGLTPKKVDALIRKWLRRLPHPFTKEDRRARFLYNVSILQAEFSLTQVLDRPVTGRVFFEQVIRDNIDIGRPDHVQLIFNRRVTRKTPSRFRTRVITEGVVPSLHVDYRRSRIKQYHKEGRALRTETVINDTYDFGIGRLLKNLAALREVGLQANRRLLSVQRISHDCAIGEDAFNRITRPAVVDEQRASALRFSDGRVLALLCALLVFRLQPRGFTNADLRQHVGPLLGPDSEMTQGKMTYDLRRLRLHGLIERIPKTHRYQVTDFGLRSALFMTRAYARLMRPGLSVIGTEEPPAPDALRDAFHRVDQVIDRAWTAGSIAA